MPRSKPSAPQRLSEDQIQAHRWQMGEQHEEDRQDNDQVDHVSDEDEDEDVGVVEVVGVKRPKRIHAPLPRIINNTELENVLECAEFYFPVSLRPSDIEEWTETLGEFHFSVSPGTDLPMAKLTNESEFWIYVSEVPMMNSAYFQWFEQSSDESKKEFYERKKKGKEPNGYEIVKLLKIPPSNFLEAFGPNIGPKRRCFSLLLKDFDVISGLGTLSVIVTESSLFKLNHPSDVMNSVPECVITTLDHLFGLDEQEAKDKNERLEEMKPDIDELYEVVKKHHEEERANLPSTDPQHPSLIPKLRPYQSLAVKWMLSQELRSENSEKLHCLYREVRTLEGTSLYYNRIGGYVTKQRPVEIPRPPGGILADEMGLGKTVEVLSLMLSNHREDVTLPEFKEPVTLKKKEKKRLRRRRTPSPVEFLLNTNDEAKEEEHYELDDKEEPLMQLDGNIDAISDEGKSKYELTQVDGNNDSSSDEETSDDEYIPRPSTSRARKGVAESDSFSGTDSDRMEDNEEDVRVLPISSQRRRRVRFHGEDDESPNNEEKQIANAKKKKAGGGILKKAKMIHTNKLKFDPAKILGGRKITEKSPFGDLILHSLIQMNKSDGSSVQSIKKYLTEHGNKSHKQVQVHFKKSLMKLVENRQIIATSHATGASGSYKINPDFDNFDSRGIYVNKADLDDVDIAIENVITEVCYEGKAFDKEVEEQKANCHKKPRKESSTYHKLKNLYESSLAEMSEALELTPEYRKARRKWNGTFFDTKVEQTDYFECICGSDLDSDVDDKYRVQCTKCQLWQHAECVKYDLEDPYRGEYVCPHCWTFEKPVESGATLIVSPTTISYQWIEEIQKHIKHKNVKMLFYKGTKQAGYIQPRDLAKYDIVITTYTILQSETNYVDLPHSNSSEGRRFRNPKRFMAIPAPLPCIEWWRICLDEAQMIECATTKTSEMALRLSAVNRWCVTGTPIEKSLNDVQGLLLFLKVDPYSLPFWWKRCIYGPYCNGDKKPLESLMCSLLWRTAKKDVLNQIDIPRQTEEIHWLAFSPVEEHFYRGQHIDCSRDAVNKIKRWPNLDVKMSSLDRNSLNLLLNPLLRLRQCCCHPQAVRGQFMNLQKQSTMTMEELLDQMIKKVVLECEDSHRQIIAALNGLAGIDIIEENWSGAVEKYREVLTTIEEYKDKIKTDTLQKLHTVTNLAEILESKHQGIVPTLRDDKLREEATELQAKYLAKYNKALEAAKEAARPSRESVRELQEKFVSTDEAWYVEIVNSASDSISSEESIMKMVRDEMSQFFDVVNDREIKQIEQKYSSSRIVLYKVSEKVTEFDTMRDQICKAIGKLEKSDPEKFLNGAVDCHLRLSAANQKNKKTCDLCKVHDNIEIYEGMIFHFVKDEVRGLKNTKARATISSEDYKELEEKGVFLLQEQKKGTWADSETERLLKALFKYAKLRSQDYSENVLSDGATHLKLIEAMKKEFKLLRILWRQIYDHVAGVDELNMSMMRLRLRFEDEPTTAVTALKRKKNTNVNLATRAKDKFETIYILEQHELPGQKLKLTSEKTISNGEFRKKYGQLLYLENLRKSDFNKEQGMNPEPCPICRQELGKQWSVLQCGHCYCVECVGVLMKEYSSFGSNRRSLRCPVCRSSTNHAEISYVNTESEDDAKDKSVLEAYESVKGSLSTKMKAVVKTLIKIQTDDPTAKSLVFSTWSDVLDILGTALVENDIQFAALHAQGKFKRNLQKFKNRDDVKVLLMPISSGANGLNLIEANHVLLVEPILNPAQELQAIGRIHRIGQKKYTTVHKFLIRSTIEERMQKILSSFRTDESEQGSHSTEENLLTLKDLKNIFVDEEDAVNLISSTEDHNSSTIMEIAQ